MWRKEKQEINDKLREVFDRIKKLNNKVGEITDEITKLSSLVTEWLDKNKSRFISKIHLTFVLIYSILKSGNKKALKGGL